jgi:polysaccharide export outer membrane protein
MLSEILISRRIALLAILIALTCWHPTKSAAAEQSGGGVSSDMTGAAQNPNTAATKPHDDTFIIGVDDILSVNVWKEPDISRSVPVRSDGMISLPLVGELQASGQTPHQLEIAITGKLKSFISEPEVTVMVQEIRSQKFNILGQVARPGSYPLTNATTVLDAIAIAGGFRDFAKQKNIYVLRQNPNGGESKLPFNYKDVIKGKDAAQNIKVEPRDTIVIP